MRALESSRVSKAAERKDAQAMFQEQYIPETTNHLSVLLNRETSFSCVVIVGVTTTISIK